jgi:lysophospholipase L1-like esterase
MTRRFSRYVALGDSSTEGLDDPDGNGGYRGWANRLAERVAAAHGTLLYANLAVRGLRTAEIGTRQLGPALAMKPDLVTFFSGTNDVVGSGFDPVRVAGSIESILGALVGSGATAITFTLPDLSPVMPLARLVAARVAALNDGIRSAAERTGTILVDIARHPVASDPRLWSEDRLHANAAGHARIAEALAHGLGLPGATDDWSRPLPAVPPRTPAQWIGAELRWTRRYLAPWIVRSLLGRSSGDGIEPKRPALAPVIPVECPG